MKKFKNLVEENSLVLQEVSVLKKGKKIYKIGDKVVSKKEYKNTVLEVTGSASSN